MEAPAAGLIEVSVDGEKVGQPFDCYHFEVAPSGKVELCTLDLTPGKHRVRFTAVGKNPASDNYLMGIDCLLFEPVSTEDGQSPRESQPRAKPETYAVPGALEAEDLRVVSWKDCFWSTVTGPWTRLWSNGRHLHCDSRLGSYVELEVSLAKGGPHKLFVYFVMAWGQGLIEVSVDGVKVGRPFDCYHSKVASSGKVELGTMDLKPGKHRVRFTAVGKNPLANNYWMGIDCLLFEPLTGQ